MWRSTKSGIPEVAERRDCDRSRTARKGCCRDLEDRMQSLVKMTRRCKKLRPSRVAFQAIDAFIRKANEHAFER